MRVFDLLRRKPFRIAAIALGGLFLLIVGLFAVLSTEPARRWALDQLTARLAEEGIGFRAKSLQLRALSLMASVDDVTLFAIGKENEPFAKADSVSVWLLWNVGFQIPSISSIEIARPALDIRIQADGSNNLPVLKPSTGPSGKPVSIGKIAVTEGSAKFQDARQALQLDLPRFDATVKEIAEGSYRVDLNASRPGAVAYRGNQLAITQLQAKFDSLPKEIKIETARVQAGGVTLAASGNVQNLDTLNLHVDSSGNVDLLAALAGYGGRIRGGHAAKLDITGPMRTPSVAGTINASNFWYDTYGPVDGGAKFAVDGALTRAEVENIQARLGSASIDGTASLALKAGAGESRVNARFGGVTSDLAAKLAKVEVPVSTTLRGSASARFPAEFNQNLVHADASLHFDAGPVGSGRVPLAGDVDVQARNGVGAVNVKALHAAGATVSGMVHLLPREQLSGDLQLVVPEITDTVATLKQVRMAPATLAGDIAQGPLEATIQVAGSTRNPQATIHAASSRLRLASTVAGALDVDATASSSLVDLRALRFEISPQDRLTMSGKMTGDALDFRGDLRHTSLRKLLIATGTAPSPSLPDGALGSQFEVSGTTAKPVVAASLESNNLSVLKQRLGVLRASIRYAADRVAIERLQLSKNGGSINAAGSYNTATKRISADANIRNYKIDTLELADGTPVRMTLNGTARTQGTAEQPSSILEVAMTDVAVREYRTKNASLRADVAGMQLKANLQVPDWKAEAGIDTSLKAPMPAQVTLALNGTPIELFTPDYTGNVTAVAHGTLNLDNAEATAKGVAELRSAVVRPKPRDAKLTPGELRVEQPATAHFDGKYVDLTPLTIIAADTASKVTVSGHIPISDTDRTGLVKVNGDIDLDWVSRSFAVLEGGAIRGRLLTDAVLAGGGKEWNPTGSIELSKGEVTHEVLPQPVSDINIRLGLRDRVVQTDSATARFLGGLITLDGRVPFAMLLDRSKPSAQPFQLQGNVEGLQLGQLAETVERPVAGEASFRVNVTGHGFDPEGWSGDLRASTLRVRIAETDFVQKSPLTINLANSLATIQPFSISGPETTLNLSGSLSLRKPNPLNLRLDGNINAAITQLFTSEVRAEGDTKLDVAVTGTLEQPQLRGRLELAGVQAEIPSATAVVENLHGEITFDGQRISAPRIEGELNGGTLTATGLVNLKGREISDVSATITARGTSWNVPEGLQTAADADIKIAGSPATAYNVTGNVKILDGVYQESMVIERGLLKSFEGTSAIEGLASSTGSRQTPILLDIRVSTVDPILVQNELLNGELTLALRVTGSTKRLGLVGRLDVNEGASFYLGGRNYLVDRGAVTFANQNKVEPILDVLGHTRAGGYDINLQARGTVGGKTANDKLDTTFTSDPPLPQADIISLLVSGRRLADLRGSESQVAQDQALSYLSGNLASSFSRQANRALGFNLPRIDPGLIADEAEPTARLTLGQDATEKLGLVYSINLRNSADQIWVGRYDITPRFQTRAVKQSDNSFRFQFQHNIEFGGVKPPESSRAKRTTSKIGKIQVTIADAPGDVALEKKIRSKLKLKEGKTFDFFALRKGVDRIKNTLADDQYPEAKVRASRYENNGALDVTVNVQTGPRVDFQYQGDGVDRKTRSKVEEAWAHSSFDSLRIRSATTAIREGFAKDRYFTPDVDIRVDANAADHKKQVVVNAKRGPRYDSVELALRGSSMEKQALEEIAPDNNARRDLAVHLEKIGPRLERFYRDRGYLDAKARTPRVVREERVLRIVTRVTEGKLIRIGQVTHTGHTTLKDAALYEAILLYPSQVYTAADVEAATTRVNDLLASEGYNQATVDVDVKRSGDLVDLAFVIKEGPQRVVKSIRVEGNQHVSDNLARTQAGLTPGEIVTEEKLNTARRNLYSTGAFNLADVEVRPQDTTRTTGSVPSDLVLKLREVRPFEVRYGVLYDTERGPGGILDLASRNILGSARTTGIRGRYDSRLQELRAYFEQPSLLRLPVKFVGTGFFRRELNETFITDRKGGSAYLEYRWSKPYLFSLGYRNEQVHTFERNPDPLFPFDIRLRIAPVTAGFSRDTRDDLLDASRGSFTSHIAEYAPSVFGSELQYAKYFGQYFYYRSLGKPTLVPWANVMKNRFVYAGGVRYGIAQGLYGQSLVPSERFFGGGPNSVRGFGQDRLGPFSGDSPVGGESIFVINNEIRFPLYKFFDGVGFNDIGQVYENWRNFRPGDLRYTGGFGLRMRTPFFLLRLDYGVVLNRKPGDPFGRLYFGIGQSF